AQRRLHLGDDVVGPGDRQVDLVEHRHDGQFALHRQVGVGDCLGLYALEGIDEQNDALAGGEAARYLVTEIDVAGCVDEVQLVLLPPLTPCPSPPKGGEGLGGGGGVARDGAQVVGEAGRGL